MAQFSVHLDRAGQVFLLDCQSDLLAHLSTRFVVPLFPTADVPKATRLNPVFDLDGKSVIMATQLASSVAVRDLTPAFTSLESHHSTIMNALDMLLTGY